MTFRAFDRVKEVATTTGTGAFTLANTVQAGFVRFSDIPGITTGDLVPYMALDATASPQAWECGYGSYNTSTFVLTRTIVTSNNLGTTAAISFAAVPTVICSDTATGAKAALADGVGIIPIVGRYYAMPGARTASASTSAWIFTPIMLAAPGTLQSLSVKYGGTVNTATLHLAICADAGGQPGSPIVQGNTSVGSGNVNTAVTISVTPTPLAPGLYWLAQGSTSTANGDVYYAATGTNAYGMSDLFHIIGAAAVADATENLVIGYTSTDSTASPLGGPPVGLALNKTSLPLVVAVGF